MEVIAYRRVTLLVNKLGALFLHYGEGTQKL